MSKHIFARRASAYQVFSLEKPPSEQDIINEKMLYGASIEFIRENQDKCPIAYRITTPITSSESFKNTATFHAKLGYHPVVDTKIVMLMPGQYPCIPGWHCDGVIRDDKNSQPNLDTLNEPISHFVLTGCSIPGACPTEYWNPTIELEFTDEEKNHVWKSLDTKIKELDNSEEGNITKSVDWAVYHMYRDAPHRGTQATKRTWRMFYRMSFYHMPCANQFRNQVVVYADPNLGW